MGLGGRERLFIGSLEVGLYPGRHGASESAPVYRPGSEAEECHRQHPQGGTAIGHADQNSGTCAFETGVLRWRRMRSRFHGILFRALLICASSGLAASAAPALVISEFLAANVKNRADENGDFEDWIELRNTTASAVNAQGWRLTDEVGNPGKWTLPSVSVPAGGYLVIFASGKDRRVAGSNLHTNFRLSNGGEYLALVEPDGETVATVFAPQFPPQANDVSYGLDAAGARVFFASPTPGAANGAGSVDRVADTRFSVDRGFFSAPFDLVISCATDGAEIRYTTNGAPPTATTGKVFSGPLRIAGTTALRAAAFKPGWLPSNVDTHSYLFTADIMQQSPTGAPPPGWPSTWGGNTRDYGMDPDVVNDPRYRNTIESDLKSLPSFCVTVDLPDLFDPTRGIYANPGQDGRSWERPMSLELIRPDGTKGFQANGGIRIRGGFSRSTSNPKHAFRFFFREEYGEAELKYPVFGPDAAESFDGFDLRTFQNYSWSFQGDGRGTFMRDQFNRDVQLAMGQPAERGDYYHLYVNGQYWGLYNTCERPEASYAATYLGGAKEDYDVIKVEAGPYTTGATDGTLAGWTQIYNLVKAGVNDTLYRRLLGQNPDGTRNPDYPVYVDADNLIDYMLIILWGGNLDAPISNFLGNTSPNNYFGIWNRVTRDRGFQFFVHDAEHTLLNVNEDRTGPFPAGDSSVTKSSPQWLWQKLLGSPEFRLAVADRVRRHFFNGGVLSAEGARALYLKRRNEIDRAVVAESARWGDSKRPSDPFNRDDDWLPAVQSNLSFIAARPAVVLQQLQADGLLPQVATPQFNQAGGPITSGFGLLMAPAGATIHYTLDGSDPRAPGGGVASGALRYAAPVRLTESVVVKARTLENGVWSALSEAEFVVIQTFKELVVSEIHYHPAAGADRDGDDFEFLELKNTGRVSLDLSGVTFTEGISYRFPNGSRLAPGAFAVLVRDPVAFKSRYPAITPAGTYLGGLANSGERLTLVHAIGTPLFTVEYGTRPPWPQSADGQGFSLVPSSALGVGSADDPSQWRASSRMGGSPGADDAPSSLVPVWVNEVLAHTDPPLVDGVELFNPNSVPAPIGGWWLTDDRGTPRKYRIPAGRTIPPGGYVVFTEQDFNQPPGGPDAFTFSSYGDEVWLFSADATGTLTGYSDGFGFGASANPVTFGRLTNSVGAVRYAPQIENSLGAANVGPRIGPVVLNEIHYGASAVVAPFVELRNISDGPVPLFDPAAPTNTWRINGLGFIFPMGVTMPPGGLAVVVASDPRVFRERNGIPESVPVFGPFPGVLRSGGETLSLERPDHPDLLTDGTWFVPYLGVDEVTYDDEAPWPTTPALGVASLERLASAPFADDPASWRASTGEPSPGAPNDGNRPPTVSAGADAEVEGSSYPFEFPLAGSGGDDGLPMVPGKITFLWSQVSGPGVVEFADATRSNTVARLPGTGAYTLRLTASDGDRSRSDEVLVQARRPSESATLVAAGAEWRYLDDGSDQGTAWRESAFNDSAWKKGNAQLGYGDGDERTTLAITAGGVRTTTFYFRRSFNVAEPKAVTGLTLHLLRDDGAMVYLNGRLVFRSNMPEGDVTSSTPASEVVGNADESAFFPQLVDPSLLVAGANTLAVEVHQQSASSSDVSFDLRLEGQVNAANRAPTADAGPDLAVTAGKPVRLAGRYSDDGLPSPPGVVSLAWRQTEGPAASLISGGNGSSPSVTFPAAGRYVLSFAVYDGSQEVTDSVVVTVAGGETFETWRPRFFSAIELNDPRISGPESDPDGDGQSNGAEFASGTHPRDPASALRLRVGRRPDGGVRLWTSVVTGRDYTVQYRTSAGTGEWLALENLGPATCDCEVEISAGTAEVAGATRFFRVVTPRLP